MATSKPYPAGFGNRFDYYAPAAPAGGSAPGVGAKALVFSLAATGRALQPYKTIKKHYPRTIKAPFGAKGSLGPLNQVISSPEAVTAALECGYGKRGSWSSTLAFDAEASRRLARYLLLRMETAAACIARDGKQVLSPRGFAKGLEKSETAAVSFIIGSIGTFLAASRWLKAGGQTMSAFLHHDVFTHATTGLPPLVAASGAGPKRPDYLVATTAGKWHVFESKGGRASERWPRIAEGLQQLDAVTAVGWASQPLQPPESKVCVHTAFDLGKPLSVTAVDPPQAAQPEGPSLRLVDEVCRLFVALETIDYFNVLMEQLPTRESATAEGWTYGSTPRFGGLTVAVPTGLLLMETEVRRRLGVYLGLREEVVHLGLGAHFDVSAVVDDVEQRFSSRVNAPARNDARSQWNPFESLREIAVGPDFFQDCAPALGLSELVNQLPPFLEAPRVVRDASLSEGVMTTGGMFIAKGTVAP